MPFIYLSCLTALASASSALSSSGESRHPVLILFTPLYYRTLGSVVSQPLSPPASSTASVHTDAGGSGSWISISYSTSVQHPVHRSKKQIKQCLNDHLASYLERVRSLKADTRETGEHNPKTHGEGTQVRDWGHYFKTMEDQRAQIFASSVDNASIILQMDNACLAADDFRVKYEIGVTWLQLETEIKALEEERLFMKNHKEEANGLQNQTANSGLMWSWMLPTSGPQQDPGRQRASYDKLAQKNREELDKHWSHQTEGAPQWSPRRPLR
ncbi:hypothetical protein QTO34_012874 [Cnephaeus nilssonii]|uniref:IF rod domain-containing protein n=1 Tax=Cnephaeus nilssonii TaxID=3371016 RepID=A0AA40LCG0_CNENI|nr:hypothetical protein QTO34_012874 [Eptesicus nilssonii]